MNKKKWLKDTFAKNTTKVFKNMIEKIKIEWKEVKQVKKEIKLELDLLKH